MFINRVSIVIRIYIYIYICIYIDHMKFAAYLVVCCITRSVNKVMRLPAYRTIWQYCGLALHMKVRKESHRLLV